MRTSLALKFVGGDPSLDLVNTVDWARRGPENERLGDYQRLTQWAVGAGLMSPAAAARLRRAAAARPGDAQAALAAARRARGVLQRVFAAVATGRPLGAALDQYNELLSAALRAARLEPAAGSGTARAAGRVTRWGWHVSGARLEAILWPVLWSAAALLVSAEAGRIRMCAGPECGWMYVDRSRNGLRRWCEMQTCGTREKSRRRAARGANRPRPA
jgi:predicted RNA-binding Zn ribbon-like protein